MYLHNLTTPCACGKIHHCALEKVITGSGAIRALPEELARIGCRKVFLLADTNTHRAAGERVETILTDAGIPYSGYIFSNPRVEPDEYAVGAAVMHFDPACDLVLAVGSGVVGDIAKILANLTRSEYVIVATAPSMDGYASATSSMTRGGLKISLPSKCARVIVGDTDILKNAPMEMLVSGLGDMLAKYISIAEWRIAHIVTGEYYCEAVAEVVRSALRRCVDNADGLLRRESEAVEAVFDGLVTAGAAMAYAGASRPASGVEHYISHIWDMRGAALGEPTSTHGIQCAVGTLIAARLYERLLSVKPDPQRGRDYAARFDYTAWADELTALLDTGAEGMIALEKTEGKYSVEKHAQRLSVIVEKWDEITAVIRAEIPPTREIEGLLTKIGCPKTPEAWGASAANLPTVFKATKDIRDKYILSRLVFDLGMLDEMADTLSDL